MTPSPRAIALLAEGYTILRPVSGSSAALGTDALMGRAQRVGREPYLCYRLEREVFAEYLERGWVMKARPYAKRGWQQWVITDAGRDEAYSESLDN